jgi:hypothetical protein
MSYMSRDYVQIQYITTIHTHHYFTCTLKTKAEGILSRIHVYKHHYFTFSLSLSLSHTHKGKTLSSFDLHLMYQTHIFSFTQKHSQTSTNTQGVPFSTRDVSTLEPSTLSSLQTHAKNRLGAQLDFPHVYGYGNLVGGRDIVLQLAGDAGALKSEIELVKTSNERCAPLQGFACRACMQTFVHRFLECMRVCYYECNHAHACTYVNTRPRAEPTVLLSHTCLRNMENMHRCAL